jgi:hypothetical protein
MDKKNLIIEPTGKYALFTIKYEGGGQMPSTLKGAYTSVRLAQNAIDIYEATKARGKAQCQAVSK